jgi:hypothetical protein
VWFSDPACTCIIFEVSVGQVKAGNIAATVRSLASPNFKLMKVLTGVLQSWFRHAMCLLINSVVSDYITGVNLVFSRAKCAMQDPRVFIY